MVDLKDLNLKTMYSKNDYGIMDDKVITQFSGLDSIYWI